MLTNQLLMKLFSYFVFERICVISANITYVMLKMTKSKLLDQKYFAAIEFR